MRVPMAQRLQPPAKLQSPSERCSTAMFSCQGAPPRPKMVSAAWMRAAASALLPSDAALSCVRRSTLSPPHTRVLHRTHLYDLPAPQGDAWRVREWLAQMLLQPLEALPACTTLLAALTHSALAAQEPSSTRYCVHHRRSYGLSQDQNGAAYPKADDPTTSIVMQPAMRQAFIQCIQHAVQHAL